MSPSPRPEHEASGIDPAQWLIGKAERADDQTVLDADHPGDQSVDSTRSPGRAASTCSARCARSARARPAGSAASSSPTSDH